MYYVIGESGKKFGPADMATLREWVRENRIQPTTQIESPDGSVVQAAFIQGLFDSAEPDEERALLLPPALDPLPEYVDYPRADKSNEGHIYAAWSWVLITFLVFPLCFPCQSLILGPIAYMTIMKAKQNGYPLTKPLTNYLIAALIISTILGIAFVVFASSLKNLLNTMPT